MVLSVYNDMTMDDTYIHIRQIGTHGSNVKNLSVSVSMNGLL